MKMLQNSEAFDSDSGRSTNLSGTVGTFEHVNRQPGHKCREDFVKFFEVLQSIEHQSFLGRLPSLTLVFTKLFTKQS